MAQNIYQTDHTKNPLIFSLIKDHKNKEAIDLLNKDQKLIHLKGWMNATPLHIASSANNFIMVQYLVENGANVNARRTNGDTALYWAPTAEVAEFLILYGASLDNDLPNNVLNWAVRYSHSDVMEILIKYGANINSKTNQPILEIKDKASLDVFVEHGANLNICDDYERNLLHYIAWNDDASLLDYALSLGIEWKRNLGGETPYHVAKSRKNNAIVTLLEEKYPHLTSLDEKIVTDVNNDILNIHSFIVCEASQTIISISKNVYLSLWKIENQNISLIKSIHFNRVAIHSIAYKKEENFFIIPGEEEGTLELRSVDSLNLISVKQLPIKENFTAITYSNDFRYLLVANTWSPIYTINKNFQIVAESTSESGIASFSFDKNSTYVSIECFDQFTYAEVYRFEQNGSLEYMDNFIIEEGNGDYYLHFNLYEEKYILVFSSSLYYYSYENNCRQLLWVKKFDDNKYTSMLSAVNYIDNNKLTIARDKDIYIIDLETSQILNKFSISKGVIRKIYYKEKTKQLILATDNGFELLQFGC